MHRAENWRDRLLGDDDALTAFLAEFPQTDAQWLRNAIRRARRDSPPTPRHARELYRTLHQMLEDDWRERASHADES
jgi:ribosome-associated protein